jgi:hypothetical protein
VGEEEDLTFKQSGLWILFMKQIIWQTESSEHILAWRCEMEMGFPREKSTRK